MNAVTGMGSTAAGGRFGCVRMSLVSVTCRKMSCAIWVRKPSTLGNSYSRYGAPNSGGER
jgi:hypothetical protein